MHRSVRETRRSRATRPNLSANWSSRIKCPTHLSSLSQCSRDLAREKGSRASLFSVRSWGFLISRRWIVFAIIVALLAYLAWWLGEWQFHRLDDRKDRNAVFERNVDADPVPAENVLHPDQGVSDTDEWRRITAQGTYDATRTVVVRYQTRENSSGVDVVVPLILDGGQGAILIDRGWLQSENTGTAVNDIPPPPTGTVTVEGWARRNATGDSTRVTNGADGVATTRAISSMTIEDAVDLPLLRGFVVLDSEDAKPADGLLAAELPDVGNGPHFFYGLQWWFFGLLAVGGFGYLAYDEWRGPRKRKSDEASDALTDELTS